MYGRIWRAREIWDYEHLSRIEAIKKFLIRFELYNLNFSVDNCSSEIISYVEVRQELHFLFSLSMVDYNLNLLPWFYFEFLVLKLE